MERCVFVRIAGREYPMSFSLGATKKIIGKFGDAKNMMSDLKKEGDDFKKLDTISSILEILIAQGCAYKNYFEKDLPKPENAPVENGKWVPITKEEIDIAIQINDTEEIVERISECITKGSRKTVEAITTGKNAKATQG